jgi:hypothetical protein
MVTIVERLAMQIRSGPVRAIFPQRGNEKRTRKVINHDFVERGRVIHRLAAPALAEPFRSPMNNYWMTNKALQPTASRRTAPFFGLIRSVHPAAKRALARGG